MKSDSSFLKSDLLLEKEYANKFDEKKALLVESRMCLSYYNR